MSPQSARLPRPAGVLEPGTLFYRVFHGSPVGMVITTVADGRFVDANEVFARLLGYSRDELLRRGLSMFGLDNPAEREMVLDVLRRTRKLGDIPIVLHDRHDRPCTCIASVQLEEIDKEAYFIIMVQDLSEHERVQQALQQSESRFRLFFRSIPLPVLVYDEATYCILDANPAACRVYGYSRDEFTALSLIDLTLPDDWAAYRRVVEGGASAAPRSLICRQRLRDGSTIEVDITSYAFPLEDRRVTLAIVRDVTEQRAIQSALRAGEEQLRIIADMTADAIWDRDLATDAVQWNAGLSSLFGYEWDEDRPHDWWISHVHPDERRAIEDSVEAAFASGQSHWTAEYRFLRADGVYANVLDRGYIVRDAQGHPTRFIGAMVDITEQLHVAEIAARAALEERQRLANDLHESVTQSLYSISLMAEAARRRAESDDETVSTEYIGRLGELTMQALRQLRLLVYELRPGVLEQEGLAGALRHRLEAVERRAGIQARLIDACEQPIPAHVQGELFRIAQEALNSALKHAAATTVTVRVACTGREATLEIVHEGAARDAAAWADDEPAAEAHDNLAALRRRVAGLGGVLAVVEAPGGTMLRATLPTAVALPAPLQQ